MAKPGRNDLCPCGSGRKYKKCCERTAARSNLMLIVVGGAIVAAIVAGIASITGDRAGATRVWSTEHGHYHDANGVAVP